MQDLSKPRHKEKENPLHKRLEEFALTYDNRPLTRKQKAQMAIMHKETEEEEKTDEPYDEEVIDFSVSNPLGITTFYSNYFIGKMGPHTLARSAIDATLGAMDINQLYDYYSSMIATPDAIQAILVTEGIMYPNSSYNTRKAPFDITREYMRLYTDEYATCPVVMQTIQKQQALLQSIKSSKYNDKYIIEQSRLEQMINAFRIKINHLINYNPYATYAWARNGGCTPEEIAGKGEEPINLFQIETLKGCDTRFFDSLSLQSETFCSLENYKHYLHSLMPCVPEEELDNLLSSYIPPQPATVEHDDIAQYVRAVELATVNERIIMVNIMLPHLDPDGIARLISAIITQSDDAQSTFECIYVALFNDNSISDEVKFIQASQAFILFADQGGDLDFLNDLCNNYIDQDSDLYENLMRVLDEIQ